MNNQAKLLREIEHDLNMWERGWPPGWVMQYLLLTFATPAVCLLMVGMSVTVTELFIVAVCMATGLCIRFKRRNSASWPQILDCKLSRYAPRDLTAWEKLCENVREKKSLTADDLTAWLIAENSFGLKVKGESYQYSFLNTDKGEKSGDPKQ